MRIALLAVAGLALVAFLVVAVVLPQMAGAQVKDAAQTLIAGAEPAKQQVGSAATKAGRLEGSGAGVKVPAKSDPKYGEMKWVVSQNGAIRGWNEQNVSNLEQRVREAARHSADRQCIARRGKRARSQPDQFLHGGRQPQPRGVVGKRR